MQKEYTLKMKTKKGHTYVSRGDKVMDFGEGLEGLRNALQLVEVVRFISRVEGVRISSNISTRYPVRSLLPPTREKLVKFFDLGEEAV